MPQIISTFVALVLFLSTGAAAFAQPVNGANPSTPSQGQSSPLNCFDYYQFGSVQSDIKVDIEQTVPGTIINFSGEIKNENPFPLLNGSLVARVFRHNETTSLQGDGNEIVDQFLVEEGVALSANGTISVEHEWQVPVNISGGEYYVAYYFYIGGRYDLMGQTASNDVVGNTTNFTISSNREVAKLSLTDIAINGEDYNVLVTPRISTDDPIIVSTSITNPTAEPKVMPLQWSQYAKDAKQDTNRRHSKTEVIRLEPGETKTLSYTVQPQDEATVFITATTQDVSTKSIALIKFIQDGAPETRLTFPGISNFPLQKGTEVTLFACASSLNNPTPDTTLSLILTDSEGDVIHEYSYNGDTPTALAGFGETFTPRDTYTSLTLTASLTQEDKVLDEYTATYDCNTIDPASCTDDDRGMIGSDNFLTKFLTSTGYFFAAVVVLLLLLFLVWSVHKRHKIGPTLKKGEYEMTTPKSAVLFALLVPSILFWGVANVLAQENDEMASIMSVTEDVNVCTDYFAPGSVYAQIESNVSDTVPGADILFSGWVVNKNSYPLFDGALRAEVYRKDVVENAPHELVDKFFIAIDDAISAKGNVEVEYDWTVPLNARAGEYMIVYFYTLGTDVELLNFDPALEYDWNRTYFTVTDTGEQAVSQVKFKGEINVNGSPITTGDFVSVTSDEETVITTIVTNDSDTQKTIPVQWIQTATPVETDTSFRATESELLILEAGETKQLLYTVQPQADRNIYISAKLLDGDAGSIVSTKLVQTDIKAIALNLFGLQGFPLKAGEEATVFACVRTETADTITPRVQLEFTVVDKDGEVVYEFLHDEYVGGDNNHGFGGVFVSEKSVGELMLRTKLMSEGVTYSESEISYDCSLFDQETCTTEIVSTEETSNQDSRLMSIVVAVIIILLLALVLYVWFKKRNKQAKPPVALFLGALIGISVFGLAGTAQAALQLNWHDTGSTDRKSPFVTTTSHCPAGWSFVYLNDDVGGSSGDSASQHHTGEERRDGNVTQLCMRSSTSGTNITGLWTTGSCPANTSDTGLRDDIGNSGDDPTAQRDLNEEGTTGGNYYKWCLGSAGNNSSLTTRWVSWPGNPSSDVPNPPCAAGEVRLVNQHKSYYHLSSEDKSGSYQRTLCAKLIENVSPSVPQIVGSAAVETNTTNQYDFTSTDPEGQTIRYGITDASCINSSQWLGPKASGVAASKYYNWTTAGTKTIYVFAEDADGARSACASKQITVTTPVYPPGDANISVSPTSALMGTALSVTWDSSNVASCTVMGPGLSLTSISPNVSGGTSLSAVSSGVFTISCNDLNGNPVTDTANFTRTTVPPPDPSVSIVGNCTVGYQTTINVHSDDSDGTQVQYEIDWGDGSAYTKVPTSGYINDSSAQTVQHQYNTSGTKTVRVRAKDTDNLLSGWKSLNISCDVYEDQSPVATISLPACFAGEELIATINTIDDGEGDRVRYEIIWDMSDPGNNFDRIPGIDTYVDTGDPQYVPHTYPSAGTYDLQVRALQESPGYIGNWNTAEITCSPPDGPPDVPDVVQVGPCQAGQMTGFSVYSNDPDGSQVQYEVDWGDGTANTFVPNSTEFVSDTGPRAVSHTFTTGNSKSIRARAKDPNGNTSNWSNYLTFNCSQPSATVNLKANAFGTTGVINKVGQTVNLSGFVVNDGTGPTPTGFNDIFEYRLDNTSGPFTEIVTVGNPVLSGSGASYNDVTQFTVPVAAANKNLYLQYCVDHGDLIAETPLPGAEDVSDNCKQLGPYAVSPNAAPVTTVDAPICTIGETTTVTFRANDSENDTVRYEVQWYDNNGSTPTVTDSIPNASDYIEDSLDRTATRDFGTAGPHKVRVRAIQGPDIVINGNYVERVFSCVPPPTYPCQGPQPTNTQVYVGDDAAPNTTTPWTYAASDTSAKCEFSCISGYAWNSSACVSNQPNLTSENLNKTSGPVQAGKTINLSAVARNNGAVSTGIGFNDTFEYRYGGVWNDYSGFTVFKTEANGALTVGATNGDTASYAIPTDKAGQRLFIQHCVDSPTGAINESNEITSDQCEQIDLGIVIPEEPNYPTFNPATCGGNIDVVWSPVSGAASYDLQYKPVSGSTWTVLWNVSSSWWINNLTPGVSYDFQIRANNAGGNSTWSGYGTTNASGACAVIPATPTNLNATPQACGTGQINLSWNSSAGATTYQLRNGGTVIYSGPATSFNHTGLTAGSAQAYTISATNSAGSSAYSSPSLNINAPSSCIPPLTVNCSVSPTSITINGNSTWSASVSGGNTPYTYSWSGTNSLTGSGASVNKTYTTSGVKTASVTVTSNDRQNTTVNCSNQLTVSNAPDAICTVEAQVNGGAWSGAQQYMNPGDVVKIRWFTSNTTNTSGTNFNTSGALNNASGVDVTEPTPGNNRTYSLTGTGSGNPCNDSVNIISRTVINASCSAWPTSIYTNQATDWSASAFGGTGSYSYSWSGTDSLSGTGSGVNKTYTTTGSKTASVSITDSAGQNVVANCAGPVQVDPPPVALTATCSASPASIQTGQNSTWTAYPSGGTAPYTYSWTGTDGLTGSTAALTWTYNTPSAKTATLTVTDDVGTIRTVGCSNQVDVEQVPTLTTIVPGSCTVGSPTTVTAQGTGENNIRYEFDWTNDAIDSPEQYSAYTTSGNPQSVSFSGFVSGNNNFQVRTYSAGSNSYSAWAPGSVNCAAPVVTVSFAVNGVTTNNSTVPEVMVGQSDPVNLSWAVTNSNSCTLVGNSIFTSFDPAVTTSQSDSANWVSGTQAYFLSCTDGSGTIERQIDVTINAPSSPSGFIQGERCTIAAGDSSCSNGTLRWSVTNPSSPSVVNSDTRELISNNPSGAVQVTINYPDDTFTLSDGSLLDSVNLLATCVSGTDWNGSACEVAEPNLVPNGISENLSATTFDSVNSQYDNVRINSIVRNIGGATADASQYTVDIDYGGDGSYEDSQTGNVPAINSDLDAPANTVSFDDVPVGDVRVRLTVNTGAGVPESTASDNVGPTYLFNLPPQDPGLTLEASPSRFVRAGDTADVDWVIDNPSIVDGNCTIEGPGAPSGNLDLTPDGDGKARDSFVSPAVTGKLAYTLSCFVGVTEFTKSLTLESVGSLEEI